MSARTTVAARLPQPRGLRREQAASYVGVSASKFWELVAEGRMPRPFNVDGCVLWDIHDLDAAFDALKDGAIERARPALELDRL